MKPPININLEDKMYQNKRWLSLFLIIFALINASCQFLGFGRKSPCDESTLKIGENAYQIQTIIPKSDGYFNIPANKPNIAYWINGTNINYVFGLSPTDNNLALQDSFQGDVKVTVAWDNCNSTIYNLIAVQPGIPDNSTLLDQSTSQVTIFVQTGSSSTSFVLKGELAEETINIINTPDSSETLAEISLLDTSTSDDGQTIRIEISILNSGNSTITLSPKDISLIPENVASMTPANVEPPLPYEIKPAKTATFSLTFPRPVSQTATLKIMTVEYDVQY